jgi:hypothetical protein
MSWDTPDVYYQPEAFDLEPLTELELYEPNYSFDTVAVWRHTPTGDLYWAYDSGCSCPSPFENYTSLDKLEKLSSDNFSELEATVECCYDDNAKADFLRKVRDALA